jgi:pheromone shutdown protein TraB
MISSQNNQRRFRPGILVNDTDLRFRGKRRKKKKTKTEQKKLSTQLHKIFPQLKSSLIKHRDGYFCDKAQLCTKIHWLQKPAR